MNMNDNSSKKNISTPFFSVVIPVYNKGPHIKRSIISVLNQAYQNFELILVNDASTDNSLEEIHKFTDKRIRLFQRAEPCPGGYAARNLGIEKAKGKWVAFLDADDEWFPTHLQKMFELAQKFPDVYFLSCGWQTQNKGLKKENAFYKSHKANETLKITLVEYLKSVLAKRRPVCTSVACVRNNSPFALNLFPSNLEAKRGGDLHAWLKIICYHKEMAWSNHSGAFYHLDSVGMVTKNASFSTILMSRMVYNQLAYYLKKEERILLKKYLNLRLRNTLIASSVNNQKDLKIIKNIYWKGDFLNALKILLLSFMPIRFFHRRRIQPISAIESLCSLP